MTIDRIQSLLEVLTEGMSKTDKRKYLKDLGFNTWLEVTELDSEALTYLMGELNSRIVNRYESKDYVIKRPVNPKSVSDIIFRLKEK